MKIDGEVCRELMLSKYNNKPYNFYIHNIIKEIESEEIHGIKLEGDILTIYLKPGGNNLLWTIEYKEYCDFYHNFITTKRIKKLERICNVQ